MPTAACIVLLFGLCSRALAFSPLHRSADSHTKHTRHKLHSASEPDEMPAMIAAAAPQRDIIFSKDGYPLKHNDASTTSLHHESYSLASKLNVKDSSYDTNRPVQVIGHRGSPYTALENTSRSFIHAAQANADGIELDVFLLKCGQLVVFHGSGSDENPGLLHLYCGVEGSILDYTAEEARRFLTFDKTYAEFGCGPDAITHPDDGVDGHYCYVHTLQEVLETIRDHPEISPEFTITIELKGPNTASPVVELVERLNMGHRCTFSSFDHSRIAEVRMLDAEATTGALFASHVPDNFLEICREVGASEVHFKYDTCTYDRVQAAHEAGFKSMAWFRGPIGMKEDAANKYLDVGNEDVEMYHTVLRSGVRSLCANRPEVLVKALEEMRSMDSNLPRI